MGDLLQSAPVWWVAAYLMGAIPVGVVLARAKGIDLRTVGSGNIGATNAARALGTKLGLVVFALDVLKAALPVWLASQPWALGSMTDPSWALAGVAFLAVFGHIFPVYLRFQGGKGVACGLGIFVALDPGVALAAMVMYVQGLVLTRTSAVGSLTAVTSICLCLIIADKPAAYVALGVASSTLIWLRHASNIRGLIAEAKARKQAQRSAEGINGPLA
ncbi:MAG: glycerol-3-phosphate acyltransferase [Myxococcota bacterium]